MTLSEPVRVGVIGAGGVSAFLHLPALKSHPRACIAAICGRNLPRLEELAHEYGAEQVFTDYRALLEQGHLQAVVIATPDDLHFPMTMTALDARLHVYCEKPLAMDRGQAEQMLTRAREAGVKHMVGFGWRSMLHFRYLRQLVEEGFVGTCHYAEFRVADGNARGGQYDWRYDPQRGRGILGDMGSHVIDLARVLLGEVASVQAQLTTHVNRPDPDGRPMVSANDSAQLLLEFRNGARAMLIANSIAAIGNRGQDQHVLLYGSQGTLDVTYNLMDGHAIHALRDGEGAFQTLEVPEHILGGIDSRESPLNQLLGQIVQQSVFTRAFIDCIVGDRSPQPDFADGARVQEVIDAAIESNRQGCKVALGA